MQARAQTGTNIALGRPATQSSTAYGGLSSHAVDGNTNGDFQAGSISHTGNDVEAWWQVDLGNVQSISTIGVWNRTDCCGDRLSQFYVLVSDVAFASTDLATAMNQSGVSSYFVNGVAGRPTAIAVNRTGRYVRVQLSGQNYLSLAEVEVFASGGATPTATPTPTPTAPSGGTNLARGRPATQSSTAFGGLPSRAVDANTNGDWTANSVSHTGDDVEAWWQVDIGSVQSISTIDVWNRTDCCGDRLSQFYVLVSDVAFASTDLATAMNQSGVSSYFVNGSAGRPTAIGVNRTGRYVRVQLSGQNYLSLAEVEVQAGGPLVPTATPTSTQSATPTPPSGGTNLAQGQPATQSSTGYGGLPSRAVDTNTNGDWTANSVSHTGDDVEAWWQVDLGGVQSITTIDIWNRTDCCSNRLSQFYVLVSDVPFVSTDLATVMNQSGVSSYFVSGIAGRPTAVGVNRTGRYVRVQLSGQNYLSLAEVQVFGSGALLPTPTATGSATATATATSTATARSTPQIVLTPIATGLSQPTYITAAGDGSGRLFVVEQAGQIVVVKNGTVQSTPFLSLSNVSCCGERGLLSVAFPPGYATKGHFYVDYTDSSGNTVVSRFHLTADPDVADASSEEVILAVTQPFSNHNGGQLQFGPDGYLYIGMGDGGSAGDPGNRAQNPSVLLGKILRIDVESGATPYAIPASNPFVGIAGDRGEIWASACATRGDSPSTVRPTTSTSATSARTRTRRSTIQPASDPGGENYGWNIMEGFHCYNALSCDMTGLTLPSPSTPTSAATAR